jgi:hypothetical protein
VGDFITNPVPPVLFTDKAPGPSVSRPPGWTDANTLKAVEANALRDATLDIRATLRPLVYTDAGALPVLASGSSAARTLAQRAGDVANVKDFGAKGDGSTDDTAAIQAAVAAAVAAGGGRVFFPRGTYLISAPITCSTSGVSFEGQGIDCSTVKASASFAGTSMFILGRKTASGETRHVSMRHLLIDVAANADCGVEMYGLRDGSTFESVYVWRIRKYGIRTGWSNQGAGAGVDMCEGLHFTNCHVLGRNDAGAQSSGAYWDLSGLYESTLISCKALGYSSATHTSVDGFRLGNYTSAGQHDCRGVRLYNCSAGNFYGTSVRGIFYGYAADCSDHGTTYENVQGPAAEFGQVGSFAAAYCGAEVPRLYNPAADTTVLPTRFIFSGAASSCFVRGVPHLNLLSGQKLVDFQGTSFANLVEVLGGNEDPTAMAGTSVLFNSTGDSNVVRARTGTTSLKADAVLSKSKYNQTRLADGTLVEATQFYVRVKPATELRIHTPTTDVEAYRVDELGLQFKNRRLATVSLDVAYSASITPNAYLANHFIITATNTTAFTINAPVNVTTGQRITITIRNNALGALGAVTWNAVFKMAAWTSPANQFSRSIDFVYNGTVWVEVSRTPVDVPN